jgi:hypothetical protein
MIYWQRCYIAGWLVVSEAAVKPRLFSLSALTYFARRQLSTVTLLPSPFFRFQYVSVCQCQVEDSGASPDGAVPAPKGVVGHTHFPRRTVGLDRPAECGFGQDFRCVPSECLDSFDLTYTLHYSSQTLVDSRFDGRVLGPQYGRDTLH